MSPRPSYIIADLLQFALSAPHRERDMLRAWNEGDFGGLYGHEVDALHWLILHKDEPGFYPIGAWPHKLMEKAVEAGLPSCRPDQEDNK